MPQLWIGSTDYNFMLTVVGGWHVGSHNANEAGAAISHGFQLGHVQERTHHYPDGDTSRAYELTDEGLAYVRQVYGEKAFRSAGMARKWYRDRVKKLNSKSEGRQLAF